MSIKRIYRHKTVIIPIKNESLKSCSIECLDEENSAFTEDGYFNDLSNDLIRLKFEEVIRKENRNVRNFIHHAHNGTIGKCLVVKYQDKKCASERFEKLDGEEVAMKHNHTNLVNELAPYQIHQLFTLANKIITR